MTDHYRNEKNQMIHKYMGTAWESLIVPPYDQNWNLLMPVIIKISEFKYHDYENSNDTAYTHTWNMKNVDTGQVIVRINRMPLFEADTLIQAAWLAAVDFIESLEK